MTSSTLLLAGVAIVALPPPLQAQVENRAQAEYCAFEVLVKSRTGTPVANADVEEVREDGTTFASAITDNNGIARLCDAPAQLVRIQVGGNRCGAVTVGSLKRYWMRTRSIHVVYQNCAGEEWAAPGKCLLTIRVLDRNGKALEGVRLHTKGLPPGQTGAADSDEYGRIFRSVRYGDKLTGQLEKKGYLPQDISSECRSGDAWDKELRVVMSHPSP